MPWTEESPLQCPNGHPWTRGAFLVGWDNMRKPRACRTWTCKVCRARLHSLDVYGTPIPPLHEVVERR